MPMRAAMIFLLAFSTTVVSPARPMRSPPARAGSRGCVVRRWPRMVAGNVELDRALALRQRLHDPPAQRRVLLDGPAQAADVDRNDDAVGERPARCAVMRARQQFAEREHLRRLRQFQHLLVAGGQQVLARHAAAGQHEGLADRILGTVEQALRVQFEHAATHRQFVEQGRRQAGKERLGRQQLALRPKGVPRWGDHFNDTSRWFGKATD